MRARAARWRWTRRCWGFTRATEDKFNSIDNSKKMNLLKSVLISIVVFIISYNFDKIISIIIYNVFGNVKSINDREAENKSTIPLQRQQLADAMVALARHRAKMRTRFPSCIETAINHALEAIKNTDLNPTPRPSNLASLESVTLMAEAEVSQFVETSRLQQTAH